MSHAIAVVLDSGDQPARWPNGPNFAGCYVEEILRHAGIFYDVVRRPDLPALRDEHQVLVLPWNLPLTDGERSAVTRFVSSGGGLVGIGGTSGLETVFGCTVGDAITTGHVRADEAPHPVTAHLGPPARVFAGRRLVPTSGSVLGTFSVAGEDDDTAAAIVEHRLDGGTAIAIGPDIVWSVLHMQQGSAIDPEQVEGIVDVEKGMVLDLAQDRQPLEAGDLRILEKRMWDNSPDDPHLAFFEPMADSLRELLIRAILYLCHQRGVVLPLLWYWPGDLPAIAHLSHDSDGNDQLKASRLFWLVNELELNTTWCVYYPGGYEKEFYPRVREVGSEIALHFESQSRQEHTCWTLDDLRFQYQWLRQEAGLDRLVSNKNHCLRWEGRLEFFRWCESVGIKLDETRGSNFGARNGFPFGGSHPWFPADDKQPGAPRIDVLEVNLMTQDLVFRCPPSFGKAFTDKSLERYGIAHFLFHPANLDLPGVEPALREIVAHVRDRGMAWWTAERINTWERARRTVECRPTDGMFTFTPGSDLPNACLLFLRPQGRGPVVRAGIADAPYSPDSVERYGFTFERVLADLGAGRDLTVSIRPPSSSA